MRRIILDSVPCLFLLAALSGCLGQNQPVEEPTDDGLVEPMCSIVSPASIPPDAYAFEVAAMDWQENASFLSQRLNETIDDPRPADLAGPCALIRPEAKWLLSLYGQDENASSTETFPNFHEFFFLIEVEPEPVPLRVWGKPYGYERWPPLDSE